MLSQCFENEYSKINLGILITSFAQATKFQGLSLSNNETNILLIYVKKAWISNPNKSQKSNHDQITITNYLENYKLQENCNLFTDISQLESHPFLQWNCLTQLLKNILILFLETCLSLVIFIHWERLGCQGPLDLSYDYKITVPVMFNLSGPK